MKKSVYVSMEMQTGTEKLAEAIVLRGFPVKVENDFITLPNGSPQDYHQLKIFLEKMQVPVFWNGDRFQLLTNRFPLQKMREIIHFHGREHSVHMEGYHFKWRSFVTRRYGIRTNTINLCPFTTIMVKALNEAGIVTLTGCNGHGNHKPNFQLSGVYYGVWFSIIQEKYMKNLSLHYNWKVNYSPGGCNAVIMANKSSEKNWDMKKVLADCYQMAVVLTDHAAELREWKKRSFKRSMKQNAETLKQSGDIQPLIHWMKNMAGKLS
ncbi:hypothetical protein QF028_002693 [Neobacillus sp. B4I6]|uniref:hypothetical protein n=1 Tax=Neobacillus sp. B4I6 TaxID=3373925 RepID=UPI003D20B21B